MALSWLVGCLLAASELLPADGLVYTSRSFELVKRDMVPRSVIYPDAEPDESTVALRHDEAAQGLAHLAQQLEPFFATLRAEQSPYPLLRQVILDYQYVPPKDQSAEHGRMYIMYVGELSWPFPAPLLADLLRLRVAHP